MCSPSTNFDSILMNVNRSLAFVVSFVACGAANLSSLLDPAGKACFQTGALDISILTLSLALFFI